MSTNQPTCPEGKVQLPTGNHTDWIVPFKYLPRSWFAFKGTPPKRTFGNAPLACVTLNGKQYQYPKPIPDKGTWYFCIKGLAFSFQTKGGWLFRASLLRWDDLANYFELLSFAFKHYKN